MRNAAGKLKSQKSRHYTDIMAEESGRGGGVAEDASEGGQSVGMSAEMAPSLGEESGGHLVRNTAGVLKSQKSRHYTDIVAEESGAAENVAEGAENFTMSAEMEPSPSVDGSGLPVRAAAAAGRMTPGAGRRIHYTDVEVGEGSSGSRSRHASEVKEKSCLCDLV